MVFLEESNALSRITFCFPSREPLWTCSECLIDAFWNSTGWRIMPLVLNKFFICVIIKLNSLCFGQRNHVLIKSNLQYACLSWVKLTDSGFEPSLPRQKARMSVTWPSGRFHVLIQCKAFIKFFLVTSQSVCRNSRAWSTFVLMKKFFFIWTRTFDLWCKNSLF